MLKIWDEGYVKQIRQTVFSSFSWKKHYLLILIWAEISVRRFTKYTIMLTLMVSSRDALPNIVLYMVRNHQDGYPYLDLSLMFFWKYTGILKKIIFIFKTQQTMVTKLGTKLGPFSTFQLLKSSKLWYCFLSSFWKWKYFFWYS